MPRKTEHKNLELRLHEQNRCVIMKERSTSDSKGYLNSLAEGLLVSRRLELHEKETENSTVDAAERRGC